MFTGLVEETGVVKEVEDAGEGKRVVLEADQMLEDASKGDSISVSGACLTVEEFDKSRVSLFLTEETLEKTWFSGIGKGDRLNLERSLKPGDRMGGHYVQGHVDTTSEILEIEELEEGWNYTFSTPEKVSRYIVEKGFLTVEGISLTIVEAGKGRFTITVIPETYEVTNLSGKQVGDLVNVEADVMAKYAEKIAESKN